MDVLDAMLATMVTIALRYAQINVQIASKKGVLTVCVITMGISVNMNAHSVSVGVKKMTECVRNALVVSLVSLVLSNAQATVWVMDATR